MNPSNRWVRHAPWIGLIFILPALYFVVASTLDAYLGIPALFRPLETVYSSPRSLEVFNAITPALFLGGITLGVALNLLPLFRIRLERLDQDFLLAAELRLKFWQLAIVGLGLALLIVMVGYALVENLMV